MKKRKHAFGAFRQKAFRKSGEPDKHVTCPYREGNLLCSTELYLP